VRTDAILACQRLRQLVRGRQCRQLRRKHRRLLPFFPSRLREEARAIRFSSTMKLPLSAWSHA